MNAVVTSPTVAVQPKSLFASKTFWVNAIVGLLALLTEIQGILPSFADILSIPPSWGRWLLFATAVANILLRRISDQPARITPEREPVVLEKFKG